MKKSERLEPIKEIAANHERDAAHALGQSQATLNEHEMKLQQLKEYRAEYARLFQEHGNRGMDGSQLQAYQTFISQIDLAIEQQRHMIEHANIDRNDKRDEWQTRHSRTQALDKTVQKFRQTEQTQENKREQREQDDNNNARFWLSRRKV
ncbi:MAG: flagellar export protein FliJ [Gammaproteobacteria bacterium]|nr:flagellar export protein FliJ [Gammaproteobacteria bacterium]MDH5778830.1 flagellar export protein FliJ [Gammaproteobacteria bacterium]